MSAGEWFVVYIVVFFLSPLWGFLIHAALVALEVK